LLLRLCFKRF